MIGVFINGVRIGSLLKFPHLKLPWCAYGDGEVRQSFRTRKEAVAWLEKRPYRWPNGCHDPDSCARHKGCMYVQCKNWSVDISTQIAAAFTQADGK